MEEKKLLRRLRRGDPAALSELIKRYSSYAYAIASNIMSHALSPEDVEEVVADSFASLWENRQNIESERLMVYLAAIVRNKAKSALRSHRETEPLEDDLLVLESADSPEKSILLSELRAAARAAVESLGQPDREIFQRYYFLYQKAEEIAADMDMNSATVRTRLARGRKRLRAYLTERGFSCADTDF